MSRVERKARDGALCPVCPLHIHHSDMLAYNDGEKELMMHWQCAELIISGDVIQSENLAAAGDPE